MFIRFLKKYSTAVSGIIRHFIEPGRQYGSSQLHFMNSPSAGTPRASIVEYIWATIKLYDINFSATDNKMICVIYVRGRARHKVVIGALIHTGPSWNASTLSAIYQPMETEAIYSSILRMEAMHQCTTYLYDVLSCLWLFLSVNVNMHRKTLI